MSFLPSNTLQLSSNELLLNLIETYVFRFLDTLSSSQFFPGLEMTPFTIRNTKLRLDGVLVPGNQHQTIQLSNKNLSTLARFFGVLAECYSNVANGKRVTQRQIYYALMHLFSDQDQLNRTILLCTSVLGVPRCMLGIGTATRGVVAGRLYIAEPGAPTAIDCAVVGTVRKSTSVTTKFLT